MNGYSLSVFGLLALFALIYLFVVVYSKFIFVPNMHKRLENRSKQLPEKIDTVGRVAILYGMCRNAMPNLKKSKTNIISLSRFFDNCKFVILENGSTDGTREFLEEWRKADDRVKIIDGDGEAAQHVINMFSNAVPNSDRWKGPKRIARYASLRNQLHAAVKNVVLSGELDPSHFICLDLDQNVSVDEKGFYSAMQKMSTDASVVAISAYGKTVQPWSLPLTSYLYDSYAFLDEWLVANGADRRDQIKSKHIWREKIDVSGDKFHQVVSNFGGMSIYRKTQEFMNNFYAVENIDDKGRCDCEHVGFNKRLQAGRDDAKLLIGFETFFDNQKKL